MEQKDERLSLIEEKDRLIEKHTADADTFGNQLKELRASLVAEKKALAGNIQNVLDAVLDKSSKALLDDVLKLPVNRTAQLEGNIQKLEIASANSRNKAKVEAAEKKKILNSIEQDEINGQVKETFSKFREWVNLYKKTEAFFYNELIPSIERGYLRDRFFHMRADDLKLSPTIKVSIDSHFKQDGFCNLHMPDVVANIAHLGAAYGEVLFSKTPGLTATHPLLDDSYFGFAPSERTDSNY